MDRLCPISVLVRNEPGVLARVAGLFTRRGYNITSLAVGQTDDPGVSRISLVVNGDPPVMEQIVKQLRRLISVIKVSDLSQAPRLERGLALVKVRVTPQQRGEITQLAAIFRAHIAHLGRRSLIVEVCGERNKIEALIDMLRPYGIIEMARTGQIVLARSRSLGHNGETADFDKSLELDRLSDASDLIEVPLSSLPETPQGKELLSSI